MSLYALTEATLRRIMHVVHAVETVRGGSYYPGGSLVISKPVSIGAPQSSAGDGTLLPVTVDEDGSGSAGDESTECSFAYDVYTYGDTPGVDTPLASAVTLTGHGNRIVNGAMTAGTVGTGFWNGATFVLIWVDERFEQKNC